MAGPVSVVNWMLRTEEINQVVLAQTEKMRVECALAIPVDAAAKDTVMNYFHQLTTAELPVDEPLTFEPKWTPVKRLHFVRDNMPENARSSKAWLSVKLCTAKLCLENQNKTYRDQSYPKAFPQINKRESNFPCSLAQITPDNKQRFNTHSVSLARA